MPNENWREPIAEVRNWIRKELAHREIPYVENMIHQVREERDEEGVLAHGENRWINETCQVCTIHNLSPIHPFY